MLPWAVQLSGGPDKMLLSGRQRTHLTTALDQVRVSFDVT